MKLVKKYESVIISYPQSCVSLNSNTAIFLTINSEDNKYYLFVVSTDKLTQVSLNYLDTFLKEKDNPVLFSMNERFGVIKNSNELYLYDGIETVPEIIQIKNKKLFGQILPTSAQLRYASPISDNNILPVCFEMDIYDGQPRHVAFLNLNLAAKQAQWESRTQLDTKSKIDNVMIKKDEIYFFTSGSKSTSVNKWGMDYYRLVKATEKGEIIETLLDSGNLQLDGKKRRKRRFQCI